MEEKENGEVGLLRGRKRLGDLGLPRGEGQDHLNKKKFSSFKLVATCHNVEMIICNPCIH